MAQQVMDGKKDGGGGAAGRALHTGGNRAAEMMAGMSNPVTAMLWALVRATSPQDRNFALLHNWLTSAVRLMIAGAGVEFKKQTVKQVASGVARAALVQFLFKKGTCKKCDGHGIVKNSMLQILECVWCEGCGNASYTLAERLELSALPIARQSYAQTCERFELQALAVLENWRGELDDHLRIYFFNHGGL